MPNLYVKTEPKSILKHSTAKQYESRDLHDSHLEPSLPSLRISKHCNQSNKTLDGEFDEQELTSDWAAEPQSPRDDQVNIYKSLYLMHNIELSGEIVKLITYSTEIFFKKLVNDLKLKSESELLSSPVNKKIVLIKLKDFLVGRTNNRKDECLNKKFKENYMNLMHSFHQFYLSQPELSFGHLLNKIDQKFIKKHHDHIRERNSCVNGRRCSKYARMFKRKVSKSNSISDEILEPLVSNSLPDNYYDKISNYSIFNPIKSPSSKRDDKNYVVFKTFRTKPLIKKFDRKLFSNATTTNRVLSASTSDSESLEDDDSDLDSDNMGSNDCFQKEANSEFSGFYLKEKSVALIKVNRKHKKMVRFADALGLDLEYVKNISTGNFDAFDQPGCVAFDQVDPFDQKPWVLSDFNEDEKPLVCHLIIVPNFGFNKFSDGIDYSSNHQKVRMTSFSYDDSTGMLKCTCKCKNLAFEKTVYARVTYNNWSTYTDYYAHFVESIDDFDYFEFFFFLPDLKTQHTASRLLKESEFLNKSLLRIELAICFCCNDQTYWDNNSSRNYVFECYMQKY
jgi:hypothetical protein